LSYNKFSRDELAMLNINFTTKARSYEKNAMVQKLASEVLLGLLSVQEGEDVLDLGCGSGGVTRKIALRTRGRVVGTDNSEGMVDEAVRNGGGQKNLSYFVKDAECLGFTNEFDVIYCNSAFQWFLHPHKVLEQCFTALKPGGRMGIQAPATSMYCPNFIHAIEKIRTHPTTRDIFGSFKSPWFFLESEEEYRQLFRDSGFHVKTCELREESTRYTTDEAYRIYQSGAENGYVNQSFYQVPVTDHYVETFRNLVRESINEQSDESGIVNLKFTRVYLVARKENQQAEG
jgi:ubiquinone/menaquinone biosynthesis C-methylase UbiE